MRSLKIKYKTLELLYLFFLILKIFQLGLVLQVFNPRTLKALGGRRQEDQSPRPASATQ